MLSFVGISDFFKIEFMNLCFHNIKYREGLYLLLLLTIYLVFFFFYLYSLFHCCYVFLL